MGQASMSKTTNIRASHFELVVAFMVLSLTFAQGAFAQSESRPKSEDLLPESTVVYVQVKNLRDLVEQLNESSVGQMLADEKVAPLAQELYAQAQQAYEQVETTVGLSLDEIKSLPAGEICFAVVAPRRKKPCFLLILDTDEESEAVTKAMDRARELADDNGLVIDTETTDDDIELEVVGSGEQEVTYFRKNGTIVASTNREVLDDVIERWMDREVEKVRPLSKNRKFVTIMNRCRGTKAMPPEMRFYVDPIKLARSAFRGNIGAQAGLNFLPVLGLDGLLAIGGSAMLNEQEFESVGHMHILLSNPRGGLFEMLALKPGEYEPQSFVPGNVSNYVTTSWDMEKLYVELAKIYNTFAGEGEFESEVQESIADFIGLDFRDEILASFSGRITIMQWVEDGTRFNDMSIGLALEIGDEEKAEVLVETLIDKIKEREEDLEEEEYEGVVIYRQPNDRAERQRERMRERQRERGREMELEFRMPQPCMAVVGNHLVVCESIEFMKRMIETDAGTESGLIDDNEFQIVSKKMTRLLGSDMPGALFYSRPDETMKMMINAAKSDGSKKMLERIAGENEGGANAEIANGFIKAFQDNPLPDFDDVKQYFRPSGAFVTNDETGYHILGFTLKADPTDDE